MSQFHAAVLAIILSWVPSTNSTCLPYALRLYDAYIDDIGQYSEGWRDLPPTQGSFNLAPSKPDVGCVIAWRFPVAIDALGVPLPERCQPGGFSTSDGIWEGM